MQYPKLPHLLLAAVLCLAGTAHAQQEIKITVSAGHAPVFLWVKHLKETFIPAVNRELAKSGDDVPDELMDEALRKLMERLTE